ncbi:MAG: helix-turn-helix transcriptional regulator [Firmicutes bacterium]|nr:helix-turn-helix transcriptional regulator [Bacillota bacterium]
MNYYEIGQRIRKIRKARGMSQDQLAEKVGISNTHMSHIETGNTKLSLSVFVDIAQALEVRTDDLLYDENPAVRSTSLDEINQLLIRCTTQQIRIIEDIVRAAKMSFDKNM